MALDFDFNNLSDTSKALMNGVPFLAGMVTDVETPYYTKLLQAVITAAIIGLMGWSASVVITNKETTNEISSQLALVNQKLDSHFIVLRDMAMENKAKITVLESNTRERVYRPEWQQKYQEQDARLLHLERAVK